MSGEVRLFGYGTLRMPEAQRALFGRVPTAYPDVLTGYTLDYLEVGEPLAHIPGSATHPVLRATGSTLDKVLGLVLELTEAELEAADDLESRGYGRREVRLRSGIRAWVYVPARARG